MFQIRNRLRALACVAALSLAGAAHATTYDISYTFGVDGTGTVNTITGTVDGTLDGSFLDDLHDFKLSYDGHSFTGAVSAMAWDPVSASFTADAPRLSFDATQNELLITNDDGTFSFGFVTDVDAYGGQLVFAGDANLIENNAASELVGAPGSGTFTLSAIPESSTLALMLAGLGVVGIAARRRASIKDAQIAAMNVEGIPRYDHIFIVMLENKATSSIRGSAYAPKINAYLDANNQFTSYFATGNPSEPNYTALGGADDFGITDDSQWNCDATGANAVQDLPTPDKSTPGNASSTFTATCTQPSVLVNHNIVGRPNLFNALTANGMSWRTYSETMNPGQDVRADSVADAAVLAHDDIYPPGTLAGNTAIIGNPDLILPMPAGAYKTKHHPGMAYQNVRSAPEFKSSNRTLGGGQWDAALMNSKAYAIPAGYDIDQFGTDLQTGDIGNVNFVVPDQCDDMHGISVTGTANGKSGTASDCGSVANNVAVATGGNIIARGDNYVDFLVKKIEASPLWKNGDKRVAIVLMFDEGNATSGYNSCCGWNPGNSTVAKPLVQNADGSFSVDTSIANYTSGNRGHGQSVFGVITNQAGAPKGIQDSDVYSHFSFVRTLQDMFQLADPSVIGSYMNRSKYTEGFISNNILNLPEYASSADTHFDSVRPMNHGYVIPAGYVQKQSADRSTAAQVGPDANQTNVWALK